MKHNQYAVEKNTILNKKIYKFLISNIRKYFVFSSVVLDRAHSTLW